MGARLESTSGGPMGSGFLPLHEGSQPPAPGVIAQRAHLPDRYGISLLELLVVDPYFVFISWEVTPAQMEQARALLGESFDGRRLRVVLLDDERDEQIAARELYGEVGRWFIQLNRPGIWLRAELQFDSGFVSVPLNGAGPVFVPRDVPVEPEHWEELFVTYSRSERGELRIDSIERESAAAWPRLALEPAAEPGMTRGGSAELMSSAGMLPRVDSELLRPLLPLAPANGEDGDD